MWQDEPALELNPLGSRESADLLCDEIRLYWLRRGYGGVKVWSESCFDKYRNTVWAIRSNMVGGLPPEAEV